jgi:tetratricopeptide (TPR) repeat protein
VDNFVDVSVDISVESLKVAFRLQLEIQSHSPATSIPTSIINPPSNFPATSPCQPAHFPIFPSNLILRLEKYTTADNFTFHNSISTLIFSHNGAAEITEKNPNMMTETSSENVIPIKKKSLLIAVFVCTVSILFLFLLNYAKHKPQKFLLRDIQINYDPLKTIVNQNPKKNERAEDNLVEAEINLKAALELKRAGKYDKALKVFQHSLALSPNHPSILTEYGIFLESYNNDIIQADSFYFRALTYDPGYQRALTERQRTAGVVQNIDEERLKRLDEKRDLLAQVDSNSAAMKRATKEAYILHIYHSVGIEGNSMTLSETRSVLETRMAVSGRSVDEHNEVLGLDAAMKYVNASLVK